MSGAFLSISLLLESISMLVKQYDKINVQLSRPHIVQTNGRHIWEYVVLDFILSSRKIAGYERILEYETIMRHISIVDNGLLMFRQR